MLGKKLKFIGSVMLVCSMFIGCTSSTQGNLLIKAPALKGETVTLKYASRFQTEKIGENGELSIEVNELMKSSHIRVGFKKQFDCYIPAEGGVIEIDSTMNLNFIGEFAEANEFIQHTKFAGVDGRMFKANYDEFSAYVEDLEKKNLAKLDSANLNDDEFVTLKKMQIHFGSEVLYPVYLCSKKAEGWEEILQKKMDELEIDKSKLVCDAYTYYLFRLSKELVFAKHEKDALIPFEQMRLHLDYLLNQFSDSEIREIIVHQTAMDYVFQQGNDPVLDETYKTYVSDPLLVEEYKKLSEKWDGLWTGQYFKPLDFTNSAGDSLSLVSNKGKYVLYHIWATWCRPCVRELSIMLEKEKDFFVDKDFEYVTLSVDEKRNRWDAFLDSKQMNKEESFNSAQYSEVEKEFAITTISRFLLCDKEGKLLSPNFYMPSEQEFIDVMTRLLGEPQS